MKSGFWTKDWFTALAVIVVVLASARTEVMRGLELYVYDTGVRMSAREPSDRVAVIAIDDKSIENIGRWPWPRSIQAEMIAQLKGDAEGWKKKYGESSENNQENMKLLQENVQLQN